MCAGRHIQDLDRPFVILSLIMAVMCSAIFRHETGPPNTSLVFSINNRHNSLPPALPGHTRLLLLDRTDLIRLNERLPAHYLFDNCPQPLPGTVVLRHPLRSPSHIIAAAGRATRWVSGSFAKVLTVEQLQYELIKRYLGFLVGSRKSDQFTIEKHGEVARFRIIDNFFLVHLHSPFRAHRMTQLQARCAQEYYSTYVLILQD
jgi:hypothetical protein